MSDEEEKSLDSFFAKKDKSKKKTKKKTKDTEQTSEVKRETLGQISTAKDEWNDFEEAKEKDYSQLKMADLQIGEKAEEEEPEEEYEEQEDGSVTKKTPGPIWKADSSSGKASPAPDSSRTIPGTENVVGGKYVPGAFSGRGLGRTRGKPGAPPNLSDQSMFPTLSLAAMAPQGKQNVGGKGDFEVVTKGTRSQDARVDDTRAQVHLGNRYDGLSRN